jgi:transcriptional regulator GlxA family with amidase domain
MGDAKADGKTESKVLRLVRLGTPELEGDPELAQNVRALLNTLERRAALGPPEQQPTTWIVALETAALLPRSPEPAVTDQAVQRALAALQLDLRRRWSVQGLAKAVGLSRAAFARRFARALGVSPIAYLAELRLARAAQRLSEGDQSLAEVAREVGYESEFAFSRAFKRSYGVPPAAYRRLRTTSAPVCRALAA